MNKAQRVSLTAGKLARVVETSFPICMGGGNNGIRLNGKNGDPVDR